MENKITTKQELRKQGFKPVKGFSIYVNKHGKVYSLNKGDFVKVYKNNQININGKNFNVPKLILQAFKGQPYKTGYIVYIDGNKSNLNIENLKYSSLFTNNTHQKLNNENLISAIRCYFQVSPNYKVRNILKTKIYINKIIEKREFFINHINTQHIEVFETYISLNNLTFTSIEETAKIYNISERDCSTIVNSFINMLSTEILEDLNAGILQTKDYYRSPTIKRGSKNDLKRIAQKHKNMKLLSERQSIKVKQENFNKTTKLIHEKRI